MGSSPSPLSPAEIGSRVRAQFGEACRDVQDVHGHAVLTVAPERYREVATLLRDDPELSFDFFDFLTAVDLTPKGRGFDVLVHLYSTERNHHVRLRVECDPERPSCPTLSDLWAGANWHEREAWELFGVVFEGHPLRKDFALMTREAKPWPGAAEGEEVDE